MSQKTPARDALARAAARVPEPPHMEREARRLYDACPSVKPAWDQLGDVTRSVWRDKARLRVAGHPRWWSCDPDEEAAAAPALGQRFNPRSEVMNPKMAKKLAEQFDSLAEQLMAISGTFRAAGDGGEDSGGDEEAGGKVRAGSKSSAASKPAAKSAAKGKKAAEQDEDVSEDDVREALQELAEAKGKGALVAALAAVGAGALKEVDESQYSELMEKVKEIQESDDEYDEDGNVEGAKPAKGKKAPAKTAPAKKTAKKPAADKDSATEKFTELVDADLKAAKALLKELGVKKFGELDEDETDWADVQGQIETALEEADDGGLV